MSQGKDIPQALARALTKETGRDAGTRMHPEIEARLAPPPDLMACHFLWAGAGVQIRASLDGPLSETTQKTGEHVTTGPHSALRGVVMELGSAPVSADPDRRFETWQVAGLLAERPVKLEPFPASRP